jgi:hypothetical protein
MMTIGALVQRKPFIGVQGAPMHPPYYGIITDVGPDDICKVVFVYRDGSLINYDLPKAELEFIQGVG